MEDFPIKTGFLDRHSRKIHIAITILLVALCTASYILLTLLFTRPQVFRITSLVDHEDSRVSPTVAIPSLVAVLSGSTLALATRAVEQNLWISIVDNPGRLSASEVQRLAQWSIPTLSRLIYIISGQSWTLRFSALLLLGCTILSPVLLYGVTPKQVNKATEEHVATNKTGLYELQKTLGTTDYLIPFAALLASQGVDVAGSSLCQKPSCTVHAAAFSLRASCRAREIHHDIRANQTVIVACSKMSKALCVSLDKDSSTANFTTGAPSGCLVEPELVSILTRAVTARNCPGEFATIFGAFKPEEVMREDTPVYAVDCRLQYGNRSITQVGTGAPILLNNSFAKSKDSFNSVTLYVLNSYGWDLGSWQISCVSPGYENRMDDSSFNFAITIGQPPDLMTNALLDYSSGLGPGATGDEVAANIEATFDMLTLLIYSKYPGTASATITTTTSHLVWNYNSWVLSILIVPLLASILVLSTNLGSDSIDKVIGYDPVRIAKSAEKILLGVQDESKSYEDLESTDAFDENEGNRKEATSKVTSNLLAAEAEHPRPVSPATNGARTW